MHTYKSTPVRSASQLPADQDNTRVIDNPYSVVMCDTAAAKPKRGDAVTLISRPMAYGLSFQIVYFMFDGNRGFIIEKAQ